MSRVVLVAPFSGWCVPLSEVPDPVFAQGMAGDGLAIDPVEGVLRAPCAGELVPMRDAKHAVTLRAAGGIDVLVHVGIDTVALGGRGFERLIEPGRQVEAGAPLVRFDLDFLARHAPSLVSPVIVAAGARIVQRAGTGRIAAGDVLMQLEPATGAPTHEPSPRGVARHFVIPFGHGLHARPAAQVAAALRSFEADVRLHLHEREANARSPVALMSLGARAGDVVEARASGPQAGEALGALAQIFMPAPAPAPAAAAPRAPSTPGRIDAVVASRGIAAGPCARLERPEIAVPERGSGEAQELAALNAALDRLVAHLQSVQQSMQGDARSLVTAHIELARDPELFERATERLRMGEAAGHAWRQATRATATLLGGLDDERMRERAADLLDLEHQLLRVLAGETPTATHDIAPGSIVVADEILPSQFLALKHAAVAGLCTARGGATSHVALLAAAADLPALVAAGDAVLAIASGTRLVLDAEEGCLRVDPPPAQWNATGREIARRAGEHALEAAAAGAPAITRDGVRLALLANLGSAAEAAPALASGAEGCGLLRTEFLYLDRREAPDEEEQRHEYQRIAQALAGRPLTIRTMDIGGDKPIAFMPGPREDNPALGLRGVRASLAHPHLLRAQLAAILRVVPPGACRVLVPMVTDAADMRFVRDLLEEERARLGIAHAPQLGAMIETPSSALLAEALVEASDFVSIGTNDLAQYTLAIDRAHPRLAPRLDALHPAVLALMARVAQAAHARGKTVSVCGGLGSDVDALPILIGLGIHEISAIPATIPRLKRVARELHAGECRALAREALQLSTASEVRALLARNRTPRPTLAPGG